MMAESAILVHDNERRWRVFGERVRELLGEPSARSAVRLQPR